MRAGDEPKFVRIVCNPTLKSLTLLSDMNDFATNSCNTVSQHQNTLRPSRRRQISSPRSLRVNDSNLWRAQFHIARKTMAPSIDLIVASDSLDGYSAINELYWNNNLVPSKWTKRCPDYLLGLSVKDIGILSGKQEDYETLSWDEAKRLVGTC